MNQRQRRFSLIPLAVFAMMIFALLLSCGTKSTSPTKQVSASEPPASPSVAPPTAVHQAAPMATAIEMHNLILNSGPSFQVRIRWLRGRMYPTKDGVLPSFDHPSSFTCAIDSGIVAISLSQLTDLINAKALNGSPLKNVSLSASGTQLKVTGTLHKGIPIPLEILGDLSPSNDQRIRIHIAKVRVLKIPMKGLLKTLHIKPADFIDAKNTKGIEVQDDDVFLDPQHLLPPPYETGKITDIHLKNGYIVEVYGDGRMESKAAKPWRNFMSLNGGTIELGRLVMHDADIFMIDISSEDWFHFDLARYQQQIVNGYVHVSPTGGLQIFMPDIGKLPTTSTNLQLMRQRERNHPAGITQ